MGSFKLARILLGLNCGVCEKVLAESPEAEANVLAAAEVSTFTLSRGCTPAVLFLLSWKEKKRKEKKGGMTHPT